MHDELCGFCQYRYVCILKDLCSRGTFCMGYEKRLNEERASECVHMRSVTYMAPYFLEHATWKLGIPLMGLVMVCGQ